MEKAQCPECNNTMMKCGKVWSGRNLKQRWLCRKCGNTTVTKIEEDQKV
jgi:transposase-like protein